VRKQGVEYFSDIEKSWRTRIQLRAQGSASCTSVDLVRPGNLLAEWPCSFFTGLRKAQVEARDLRCGT